MNQIACITSTSSLGATFVDWSIHYLSGKDKYFSTVDQQWVPLTFDPLIQSNAHKHKKNHPSGWQDTKISIETLKKQSEFVSFYPYPLQVKKLQKY